MGNMYRSYKEVTHTQQLKVDVVVKEKGNSDRLYEEVTHTRGEGVASVIRLPLGR